jgi:hypothetical protein
MEVYWPMLVLRMGHCIWPYSTRIRFHSQQSNLIHSYRSIDHHIRTFKRISVYASITDNQPNYHSQSPPRPFNHHPHNHLHTVFTSRSITSHLMRNRRVSLNILILSSHLVISLSSTLISHAIDFYYLTTHSVSSYFIWHNFHLFFDTTPFLH